MKIIMYEGPRKHAMRGSTLVDYGTSEFGGDYELDANFKNSHPKILAFAKKMWKDNYRLKLN